MKKTFNSLKIKKTFAFLLVLVCTASIGGHSVLAKTGTKATNKKTIQAARMISGMFDFIKNSNKDKYIPNTKDEITIKVYFHKEKIVRQMSLDDYISGVLYGEVPSYYCEEALKAQAIAARSYTLYRIYNGISHAGGADICTDYTHCQAWTPREENSVYPEAITKAVKATENIIATYNGKCINALYFSNSGGNTEAIENVWGGSPYPYLKSVSSPGEADFYDYCQVKSYSLSDFANAVTNYNSSAVCDNESGTANVKNIKRSPSGRIISAEIGGITFTGLQIRAMFSLRSSNIYFSDVHSGEGSSSVAIVALGYGHGVGMSQCGAQAMALNGADYEEILKHYYTGIELSQITSLQE